MKSEEADQISEWLLDFSANQRRKLRDRWDNSFVHTYKPVLDDVPFRCFDSLKDYRSWCAKNLPSWLGYGQEL